MFDTETQTAEGPLDENELHEILGGYASAMAAASSTRCEIPPWPQAGGGPADWGRL